jgi:hypothetical protein
MTKSSPADKKLLKDLNAKLKKLQAELVVASKATGLDAYISVKVTKSQVRYERVRIKDASDKGIGEFYLEIAISAKEQDVFIPLSIASGKRTAGFMYQIEGTDAGAISTADVSARGAGINKVTVGTLLYAKIPAAKTAEFQIKAEITGKVNEEYKIVINRINYKRALADARYKQYLKETPSKLVKFQ